VLSYVWIFPSFLSVVEAFAYNGKGDETALKRLGPCCRCFNVCSFLVDFCFCLPRVFSRLQTPSKLHLLSLSNPFSFSPSVDGFSTVDTVGRGVATDVRSFFSLCFASLFLAAPSSACIDDEFVLVFFFLLFSLGCLCWADPGLIAQLAPFQYASTKCIFIAPLTKDDDDEWIPNRKFGFKSGPSKDQCLHLELCRWIESLPKFPFF